MGDGWSRGLLPWMNQEPPGCPGCDRLRARLQEAEAQTWRRAATIATTRAEAMDRAAMAHLSVGALSARTLAEERAIAFRQLADELQMRAGAAAPEEE